MREGLDFRRALSKKSQAPHTLGELSNDRQAAPRPLFAVIERVSVSESEE